LFAVAGRDKRRDAHVNTDDAPRRWQGFRRGNFTGKAGVPFARLQDDAQCFGRAFHVPVPAHGDATNARELQLSPVYLPAVAVFLQPEAVEAVTSFETRIPRPFARLHTAKECLKRLVAVGCGNL